MAFQMKLQRRVSRVQTQGRKNERIVEEAILKLGYDIINVNEKGFPDLIVLRSGRTIYSKEVVGFIEVKGPKHRLHNFQKETHEKLKSKSFAIATVFVKDEKIQGLNLLEVEPEKAFCDRCKYYIQEERPETGSCMHPAHKLFITGRIRGCLDFEIKQP